MAAMTTSNDGSRIMAAYSKNVQRLPQNLQCTAGVLYAMILTVASAEEVDGAEICGEDPLCSLQKMLKIEGLEVRNRGHGIDGGGKSIMEDKHHRLTHTDDMERCSFLVRGKWPCKNRRTSGMTVCQFHEPTRLAREREMNKVRQEQADTGLPMAKRAKRDHDKANKDSKASSSTINSNIVAEGNRTSNDNSSPNITTDADNRGHNSSDISIDSSHISTVITDNADSGSQQQPQLVASAHIPTIVPISASHSIIRISASQKRMFNPLATPLSDPGCTGLTQSWSTLFHDPGLPLHIDLGCARGRLVFELAAMHKDRNYIGIEVRDKLVIEANRTIELNRLSNPTEYKGNCTFVCANMLNEKHREQLEQSLSQYPGTVERISILFPDPWIKKKHRERRIVQTHVLESVHRTLRPGGELVIASDVEDLMIEAKGKLEQLAGLFVAKPGRLVVKPTPTLTKASTTTTARGDVSSTGEMVIGTDVPALPNEEIINDVNDVGGSKDAATAMTNSNSNSSSRSSSNSNESIISALDGRRTTITKGGREAAVSGTVNEVENKVENEVEDVEVDESGYVLTNPFHPLASEREQVRVKS